MEKVSPDKTAPETITLDKTVLVGDVIRTRKPHPCGGSDWTVTRTGADIKMRCNTCGRLVMLDRDTFLRRRKALISRPDQTPDA